MKFDKDKYKVYTWKQWQGLLWILNPVAPVNELVLGQRIPKVMLIDKLSDKPFFERQVVPCPNCNVLHNGRLWSGSRGFKNWFGYYCPACCEIIPCVTSLASRIVLLITLPYWFWFKEPLKHKWLAAQPARFENVELEPFTLQAIDKPAVWATAGLFYGAVMFFLRTPLDGGWPSIAFAVVLWSFLGLGYSYLLRLGILYLASRRGLT